MLILWKPTDVDVWHRTSAQCQRPLSALVVTASFVVYLLYCRFTPKLSLRDQQPTTIVASHHTLILKDKRYAHLTFSYVPSIS
ncbi:uncharacterized protein CYBJADRAFT_20631 [Cyberlindnera jadinii NRRL Y-1542]|uniref:Uncharacterized protein n=1 Tax=Cyberlindnera jadinii (strain ATCC 18201 / CBS 1600 / BCRC 20928 / JCM 3617 / NBRC 0987 / NRRL Y-1542) TaxID=983966 RepID=A0A1E4RYP0_CYBJN|nr:hypothetical protein CYBJADRAFT_20631 [Cyberlindnera jadinii NRRL Y-1542]ODV72397.1 hypothetical protein CYBJADRAFT_20631 [Cyberlindnera jadinii NRRL Y-1542]